MARSNLSKFTFAGLLSAGILVLAACGPKSPPDPPVASDAASDAAAVSGQAASSEAAAAISSAAEPAAGTVANARGENQKGGKPTVNVQEEVDSRGGEAPQALRDKVDAAKAAGRAPPQSPGGPQQ